MSKRQPIDLGLTGFDELFMTEQERHANQLPRIYDIPIAEIDDFPGHPYKIREDEDMEALIESIREHGVLTPATVRQKEDGRYELISGHRRKRACELAGIETLRCDVVELDRDAAVIRMVDSNCQRSKILPSEKAFAYRMKLEAIKRQGERTDLTSRQVGEKFAADRISDTDSGRQVQRYIRLTYLIPKILEMVDNGKIALSPAVELSYLTQREQSDLLEMMELEERTPSLSQANRMHKLADSGELDEDSLFEILSEEKGNQAEYVKVPTEQLRSYFHRDTTPRQMAETIIRAMEYYNEYLERQRRSRDER